MRCRNRRKVDLNPAANAGLPDSRDTGTATHKDVPTLHRKRLAGRGKSALARIDIYRLRIFSSNL